MQLARKKNMLDFKILKNKSQKFVEKRNQQTVLFSEAIGAMVRGE